MADAKIHVSIRLTAEQISAIRAAAQRLGITEGDAHRRFLDAGIDMIERIARGPMLEAAARQIG